MQSQSWEEERRYRPSRDQLGGEMRTCDAVRSKEMERAGKEEVDLPQGLYLSDMSS